MDAMAAQRVSVSLDDNLVDGLREIARAENKTFSAVVSEAVDRSIKLRRARLVLDEWEAESPIPSDIAAEADAKLAETFARLAQRLGHREEGAA
jgi:hypothetical protein